MLMLKMYFQASKKLQGFSSDSKILLLLLSVLFHIQNHVSVLCNFKDVLIFWRYLGKRSLCAWNQPHFLKNSDKSLFTSRAKQIKRNLRHRCFCRQKTAEDNNAKINLSPNIPCTFLLFKASVFLQVFFPRNLLFQQVLRMTIFLNYKYLTFLYFYSYLFFY